MLLTTLRKRATSLHEVTPFWEKLSPPHALPCVTALKPLTTKSKLFSTTSPLRWTKLYTPTPVKLTSITVNIKLTFFTRRLAHSVFSRLSTATLYALLRATCNRTPPLFYLSSNFLTNGPSIACTKLLIFFYEATSLTLASLLFSIYLPRSPLSIRDLLTTDTNITAITFSSLLLLTNLLYSVTSLIF